MPSTLEFTPRPVDLLRAELRSVLDLLDECGLTDPAPGAPECATSATATMDALRPALRASGAAPAADSGGGGPR
ncbi:MAG: hypothetical protein HYY93_05275 [Planctomycetes bacterium]|nr:hypothetical protein [Planctomycetota bacterium]